MAVLNLVITIILSKRYGAPGAAFGTGLSFILANGIVMNIYYHKQCNIDILAFWKEIMKLSKGLVIPIIIGIVINRIFPANSIGRLIVCIAIYTIAYLASMWFLGMNTEEKAFCIKICKRILRR